MKDGFARQTIFTRDEISKLTVTGKEEISRLELKINETKVETIRWVFAFWISLAVMIFGIYLKK
jgi:hypothetical protein